MNNNIGLLLQCIAIVVLSSSCEWGCDDCDSKLYKTSATIYLINETSDIVTSTAHFGYTIQPGDTLVHKEAYESEWSEKPTADTYNPFATTSAYLFYYEGDKAKCTDQIVFPKNYENRKEVSPLVFELTYRFTEEKRAKSIHCCLVSCD